MGGADWLLKNIFQGGDHGGDHSRYQEQFHGAVNTIGNITAQMAGKLGLEGWNWNWGGGQAG